MEKWEYLIVQATYWKEGWGYTILDDNGLPTGKSSYITVGLNQLGDEGWELAGIHDSSLYEKQRIQDNQEIWWRSPSQNPILVFKRRKP